MAKDNLLYESGEKINQIFESLSEVGKMMALVYVNAIRDKEIADRQIRQQGS